MLFELVDEPPAEAENYQFESVEVKETAFRIDGVFLPPDNAVSKTVFFAEVQFQKDERKERSKERLKDERKEKLKERLKEKERSFYDY